MHYLCVEKEKNVKALATIFFSCGYLHPELLSGHDVVQQVPHLERRQVQKLVRCVVVVLQVQAENQGPGVDVRITIF
jgi:hypothetical protein